jgi:hypothetical protein
VRIVLLTAGGAMPQPITPDVLVAYRQCPRKAFLLLCTDEEGSPHDYASMLARQQAENRASFIGHLKQQHPEARPYAGKLPGPNGRSSPG